MNDSHAEDATHASNADAATIALAKSSMRHEMRARIAMIPAASRAFRSAAICAQAARAPMWSRTQLVLAYRALPDEVDVDPLLRELLTRGVRLAFPAVSAQGKLRLFEFEHSAQQCVLDVRGNWTRDRFGIRAPRATADGVRVRRAHELDAVIVPARAFDDDGMRLGRGKGFYDALLASLRGNARRTTMGFAFREQIVALVPRATHDQPVAWLASETGVRRVKTAADHAANRVADSETAPETARTKKA